jgi:hypothetical protein
MCFWVLPNVAKTGLDMLILLLVVARGFRMLRPEWCQQWCQTVSETHSSETFTQA